MINIAAAVLFAVAAPAGAQQLQQMTAANVLAQDLLPQPPQAAAPDMSVFQELPAQSKSIQPFDLAALLHSPDPAVRLAAVKAAKRYIANTFIYEPVLAIYANGAERLDIRIEAARTLSYVPGQPKVYDTIGRLLMYGGQQPQALRVMSYKALFGSAAQNPVVQEFLIGAVMRSEQDPVAHRAAIWALFGSVRNLRPHEALVSLVRYGAHGEATKVEAIKSLYGAMGYPVVNALMMDIVNYGVHTKPIRLAAIKALSGATGNPQVMNLLYNVIRYERDPELRAAAVWASAPDMAHAREFFHLGYYMADGTYVSPIEGE